MIEMSLGVYMDCAICNRTYYTEVGDPVCSNRYCQEAAQLPKCLQCDERMDSDTFSGCCEECDEKEEEEEA